MGIKLVIKGRLDGLNKLIDANRRNKYAGAQIKKDNQQLVCLYIKMQSIPHFKRIKIIFNWYEKDRRRDLDNIASAKKFILDALTESGVIDNDSQKYIYPQFTDNFFIDKNDPRIEVDIQEVENE